MGIEKEAVADKSKAGTMGCQEELSNQIRAKSSFSQNGNLWAAAARLSIVNEY